MSQSRSLRVEELSARIGHRWLFSNVRLSVERGEVLGIVGPNGSGKTVLLDILCGLRQPATGTVLLGDLDISELGIHSRARLGILRTFQEPRLVPGLTVAEHLRLGRGSPACDLASSRQGEAAAIRLYEATGMASWREALTEQLSGGQKRLVMMATALWCCGSFFLADEPFGGLSDSATGALVSGMAFLRDEVGVIIVEHRVELLRRVADRIVALPEFEEI